MRVISIKNYCDNIRVIIQLMQYHNKVQCMSRELARMMPKMFKGSVHTYFKGLHCVLAIPLTCFDNIINELT